MTYWCCARSLGWCFLVSWSWSHSERLHSEDLGGCCETLFLVRFVSFPLLDSTSHRLIPSYCQNNRAMLECASLSEVCCPVTLHTFRSFLRVIARLARFVTRWREWARKEIRHILGFVAHTAEWSLIMKSADDDWEELRLSTSAMRRSARDVSEGTKSS